MQLAGHPSPRAMARYTLTPTVSAPRSALATLESEIPRLSAKADWELKRTSLAVAISVPAVLRRDSMDTGYPRVLQSAAPLPVGRLARDSKCMYRFLQQTTEFCKIFKAAG